ncbi:hypothetical protein HKD37_04G010168 [Glycine soja]
MGRNTGLRLASWLAYPNSINCNSREVFGLSATISLSEIPSANGWGLARLAQVTTRSAHENITSRVQQNFPTKRFSLPLQEMNYQYKEEQSLSGRKWLRRIGDVSFNL